MRRRNRSSFVALTIMLVVALVFPSAGFADITDFGENWVSTSTNPGEIEDYDVVWRENWGNNPMSQFDIKIPQPDKGQHAIVGGFYFLTKPSADTTIHSGIWGSCYNAPVSDKSTWNLKVDYPGEFFKPGPLWDDTQWTEPVGSINPAHPYEGVYQIWVQMFAKEATETARGAIQVGLDMTPPDKVTNLVAGAAFGDQTVNGWLKQSRVHLQWEDKVYDRLSGTGYFEIFLDGKPYPTERNPQVSRKVYDLKEHYPGWGPTIATARAATIEDLPAGKHTLQVRAVDRATNMGALSAPVAVWVDPDEPAPVVITSPVVSTVGASAVFSATTSDAGGIECVEFKVDGVKVGTATTAPYTMTANLSGLTQGQHELKVTARDMAGRETEAKKTFVLDSRAPVVTGVVNSAGTIYPAQRDGYLDDAIVSFGTDEAGTATLTVKNAAGVVVRTVAKACAPGANTVMWDGMNSFGGVTGGSYTMTLTYADAVGNKSLPVSLPVAVKAKTDEIAPKLSSVKANLSTFFPRKRDGYKDNFIVKFNSNEAGTAKLTIKNSKGKVVRTVTKRLSRAGSSSITWNGKYTSGKVHAGKFTCQLTFSDASANVSSASSRKVTIKLYELKRTAKNAIKVVQR